MRGMPFALTDAAKAFMTSYNGLLNNPKYSNPPVDLAVYKAGIDQCVDYRCGRWREESHRGPNSGDVVVLPGGQTGAVAFDVRYALQGAGGVLGPWTVVTVVKPRKVTINWLTQAGIYQFQIRALGVLDYTDWIDSKTFVVA